MSLTITDLSNDVFTFLCTKLDLYTFISMSKVSQKLQTMSKNPVIWREFCLLSFGIQSLDAFPKTKIIQVNKKDLLEEDHTKHVTSEKSWELFCKLMYCSEVYTWGDSSRGRLGHPNVVGVVNAPKLVEALQGKSIKYLGKTAEVGSCAFSFSGNACYLWGSQMASDVPLTYLASSLSPEPGDHIAHLSCGHDSGFIIVMSSGRVYNKIYWSNDRRIECISQYILDPYLQPNEKPIWSIGSQSAMSGVVTNHNRVIAWATYDVREYITRTKKKILGVEKETEREMDEEVPQVEENMAEIEERIRRLTLEDRKEIPNYPCYVVEPVDVETGESFEVKKVAFGHRNWFAIGPSSNLYWIRLRNFPEASTSPGTQCRLWTRVPNTENLKIIDVDSGTNHSGFVTEDGDVYTWGDGAHGCLGHGTIESFDEPTRVEFFRKNGMKAVAIGCGGYVSWSGGFTIVLLDDNRLFYFGKLGNEDKHQLFPEQVVVPDRLILSISAGEDWAGIVTCKDPNDF